MRLDAFELDLGFRDAFTMAEVVNGQARVLRFIHLENAGGDARSYLHLRLEVDGRIVLTKAVRKLAANDAAEARKWADKILAGLTMPPDTPPGRHRVRIVAGTGRAEHPFAAEVEVLDASYIPTNFARAELLAAYVRKTDALRHAASLAVADNPQADTAALMEMVYVALREKQLCYHPVSGRDRADCQAGFPLGYTLENGGSCADLSLLYASMLWSIGCPPALLLFEDHMAAGCFLESDPAYDRLDSPQQIMQLLDKGLLCLVEITSVCSQENQPFAVAVAQIRQRLERKPRCVLVNVQKCLRGGLRAVPEPGQQPRMCRQCGFPLRTPGALVCQACGEPIPPEQTPPPVAPAPRPVICSAAVQYGVSPKGAAVLRLIAEPEELLTIQEVWQGQTVRSIGKNAFADSGVRHVILPVSIRRIGDYAFSGCKGLTVLQLPEDLDVLGTGAFTQSGLTCAEIPGGVKAIPRLAFSGCESLETVTLHEGLEQIGERAFEGCNALKQVTIPATVKRISHDAFPPQCELTLCSPQTRRL